jgi:hypothetical protein
VWRNQSVRVNHIGSLFSVALNGHAEPLGYCDLR